MSCRHDPHLRWLGAVPPALQRPTQRRVPRGARAAGRPRWVPRSTAAGTRSGTVLAQQGGEGKHSRSKPNALKYSTEIFHTTYINVCLGPETLLFLEATNDTKPYVIL